MALALVAVGIMGIGSVANADTSNFNMTGKIYTKYLYQNDDSRGCTSLSNPFWPDDNTGGHNGVCSEFELGIEGRVSRFATAGIRLKSRFGSVWQTWWENGDWKPDQEDTSGQSLGMNYAQYLKLRGAFVRLAPPIPTVKWMHVGSTDLSMFNAWTVGKLRYIDRDNGNAVLVQGQVLDGGLLDYHVGAIAVPKLSVGPGWNTGLINSDSSARLWQKDWAYAAKIESQATPDLNLRLVGVLINDLEADRYDPDLTGEQSTDRNADHAVDLSPRFRGFNSTFEFSYLPSFMETLDVSGVVAYSYNKPYTDYIDTSNRVEGSQGMSPLVFLQDDDGEVIAAKDIAGVLRLQVTDPLNMGVSFKLEYFNIGEDFNAIFGARREADVLLTDGVLGSGFYKVDQLPTLNTANEFVDFDESWVETVIGWHGVTGVVEWVKGPLNISGELTGITYNTNEQDRDTDAQYPDFDHTDGFTDIQAFTADYDFPNVYDRGRDPRNVYRDFQKRRTLIAVVNGDVALGKFRPKWKAKYVFDNDKRKVGRTDDNYHGTMYIGFAALDYQATDELKTSIGYEFQYWDEKNRSGSQSAGYFDYTTKKHSGRFGLAYNFGGASIGYLLEYFHKDQERARPGAYDQRWRVWRSKATMEVSW